MFHNAGAGAGVRLVLVNYEYPPLGGGAGNATECIARALARHGHQVRVITSAFGEFEGMRNIETALRVIRLKVRRSRLERSSYTEKLSFVLAAARALPQLLRAEPAEGLIVFFSLPCGPLGWLAHRRCGTPYVISLRGGDVPGAEARVGAIHRLLAPLRRAVLRNALAVVANSPGLARLSERADHVRTGFVANGVDTGYFTPGPKSAEGGTEVRFLFAGRFQQQKNLFVLLDCYAAAVARSSMPLSLVLIGDGPQRHELEAHARKLGVAGRISWPGWLDKSALRDAYRNADVFLNPSLYEGMPNTVLEAMACGLPVIASRVMGNLDLIADGITGLLFDLDHPDDLTFAISMLAGNPECRDGMGARACKTVREQYTWDATASQYVALFQRD